MILGTGPSLTPEAIKLVNDARLRPESQIRVFAINNVYQTDAWIDVFFACNPEWWSHYYPTDPRLRDLLLSGNCEAWTWDKPTATHYGLNWIEGRWSGGKRKVHGFSTDPTFIHYGHGSGYEVLNVAFLYGCRRFVLCGYDLRYPRDYDPVARFPGTTKRHFFGEYPRQLQHFPGVSGKNVDSEGRITGLLDCYRTIDCDKLNLTIVNCSPGTALDFFETGDLEKELANDTAQISVD